MRDQARLENMHHFMDKEEEWQRMAKPIVADVDQLAAAMAGPPQQAAAAEQQETPPPQPIIPMDMGSAEVETEKVQGDDPMGDDGAPDET